MTDDLQRPFAVECWHVHVKEGIADGFPSRIRREGACDGGAADGPQHERQRAQVRPGISNDGPLNESGQMLTHPVRSDDSLKARVVSGVKCDDGDIHQDASIIRARMRDVAKLHTLPGGDRPHGLLRAEGTSAGLADAFATAGPLDAHLGALHALRRSGTTRSSASATRRHINQNTQFAHVRSPFPRCQAA